MLPRYPIMVDKYAGNEERARGCGAGVGGRVLAHGGRGVRLLTFTQFSLSLACLLDGVRAGHLESGSRAQGGLHTI